MRTSITSSRSEAIWGLGEDTIFLEKLFKQTRKGFFRVFLTGEDDSV